MQTLDQSNKTTCSLSQSRETIPLSELFFLYGATKIQLLRIV
jgi:hypothetical protein